VTFASRKHAGQLLGQRLLELQVQADLVLGLPRGGVVVAAEVAQILNLPLNALIVRKIGHPFHREFAVGALAEGNVLILDEASIGHDQTVRRDLDEIIAEEKARLREYDRKFHGRAKQSLSNKRVILVDDGLATGATMLVAAQSAARQQARSIAVAVPVASTHAVARVAALVDEVISLRSDPYFEAVGRYYRHFDQTSDEEVMALLGAAG
jgi:predicted phosphoribosyltransferase